MNQSKLKTVNDVKLQCVAVHLQRPFDHAKIVLKNLDLFKSMNKRHVKQEVTVSQYCIIFLRTKEKLKLKQ